MSWDQASDKIPVKVVIELLKDLITHVNTCLLLRNNRLLFTLNWETIENADLVWEHLFSTHLNQKRRIETPEYQCDYMLTSVMTYPDLVDIYCYALDGQGHTSFLRDDVFDPGYLPVVDTIEPCYLPPQFGSTPKKPVSHAPIGSSRDVKNMSYKELQDLVEKLLKEKEDNKPSRSNPQSHVQPPP